ncbi:hypothetical protein GCM10023219_21360 [Stakelama sediminis]|uniref:Uncharacterized protein n=1 Tax=Stakelama sediminis TaxID=463200 RepID=A0A840Z2M3_9SPHN|nr:hypothetical protein [Stakelama sediminis]MBB5720007.1 hypothetical protein [Stakelama sediminis]
MFASLILAAGLSAVTPQVGASATMAACHPHPGKTIGCATRKTPVAATPRTAAAACHPHHGKSHVCRSGQRVAMNSDDRTNSSMGRGAPQ